MTQQTALQILNRSANAQEKAALEANHWAAVCTLARPSSIWKPTISKDGNKWCALYGENLQVGVAGFGDTPNAACRQFDIQWLNEVAK